MIDKRTTSVLCLGLGLLLCCESSSCSQRTRLDRVRMTTKKIMADIVKLRKDELTDEKVNKYSGDLREKIKTLESIDDKTGKVAISRALLIDYISLLDELRDYVNDPTDKKAALLRAYGDTDPTIRPVIEHFVGSR